MLLGTKKTFLRHLLIGIIALLLFLSFWYMISGSSLDIGSSWRALAVSSFVLLAFTLAIGPLAVLWKPALKLLTWRRETGIWFALLALGHGFLVSSNMFGFDISLTFHPSVALPNIMGGLALFFALVLAATSSDRAVRFLSIGSWKWLHYSAYTVFYLSALHALHYSFINPLSLMHWSRYLTILLAVIVLLLQFSAFSVIVSSQRKRSSPQKLERVKAKIISRKEIAKGTYEVLFSVKEFPFAAGQHIGVHLPKLTHSDVRGNYRVFSIVTSPGDQYIGIAFRNTRSGFKKTLLEMRLGEKVWLDTATGYFTLPWGKKDLVFVAGGIGITPFMSMIRYASEEKLLHKITLIYSNKNRESAAYLDELRRLTQENKRFYLKEFYDVVEFRGAVFGVKSPENKIWYIAGPPGLVSVTKSILFDSQVPPGNIVTEEFSGY